MIPSVDVYVDAAAGSTLAARAYFSRRSRTLTTSVRYDATWLRDGYMIDPELPLTGGTSVPARSLPGAFSDAAPDRWGRNLIAKRHAASARTGHPAELDDVDFLLGVSDLTRQGALRFRVDETAPFMHDGVDVPRLLRLPELLRAAEEVATDSDDLAAVKALLDAGTGSLGGARPKASVLDDSGRLAIAKFPHPGDAWAVIAAEAAVLELAARAGIQTPSNRLVDAAGQPVLLLDRFDRGASGERVAYVSAMTLTASSDGDTGDYLDVVDAIAAFGSSPTDDLQQLWRRIAFSIAVRNTDDHLRNHGFLHDGTGWRLAPAFDINVHPTATRRATAINGVDAIADEAVALVDAAEAFGISHDVALSTIGEVLAVVATWATIADEHGVPIGDAARLGAAVERGSATLLALCR